MTSIVDRSLMAASKVARLRGGPCKATMDNGVRHRVWATYRLRPRADEHHARPPQQLEHVRDEARGQTTGRPPYEEVIDQRDERVQFGRLRCQLRQIAGVEKPWEAIAASDRGATRQLRGPGRPAQDPTGDPEGVYASHRARKTKRPPCHLQRLVPGIRHHRGLETLFLVSFKHTPYPDPPETDF